jgi:hypothetical protein
MPVNICNPEHRETCALGALSSRFPPPRFVGFNATTVWMSSAATGRAAGREGRGRTTGHATSSINMEVPASRAPPTMGMSPLRTSQNSLHSPASLLNGYLSMLPSRIGMLFLYRAKKRE